MCKTMKRYHILTALGRYHVFKLLMSRGRGCHGDRIQIPITVSCYRMSRGVTVVPRALLLQVVGAVRVSVSCQCMANNNYSNSNSVQCCIIYKEITLRHSNT